jgi:hypothetical protein
MAMVLTWPMSAFKLRQVLTTWRKTCDREDYDAEVDKHCPKQLLTNSGVPGPVDLSQLPRRPIHLFCVLLSNSYQLHLRP